MDTNPPENPKSGTVVDDVVVSFLYLLQGSVLLNMVFATVVIVA